MYNGFNMHQYELVLPIEFARDFDMEDNNKMLFTQEIGLPLLLWYLTALELRYETYLWIYLEAKKHLRSATMWQEKKLSRAEFWTRAASREQKRDPARSDGERPRPHSAIFVGNGTNIASRISGSG